MARVIPKDGRIDLPSDLSFLRTLVEMETAKLEMEQARKRCQGGSLRESEEAADKRDVEADEELLMRSMVSFFSDDFQRLGLFVIRDIDPDYGFQFLYDMGRPQPLFMVSETPLEEMMFLADWKRFKSIPDVLSWQDSQKNFCQVDRQISSTAPWQRIILCQGLSFGSMEKSVPITSVWADGAEAIRLATELHLSGQRRGGSELTNPYSGMQNAFHITFFERLDGHGIDTTEASQRLNLKIGHLYERPKEAGDRADGMDPYDLAFRRSSFTLLTAAEETEVDLGYMHPSDNDWHWTMLILSPTWFFIGNSGPVRYDWNIDMGRASRQTAELSCVVYALGEIEQRWRRLDEYLESLLVEDFMDSAAYSKLLFDDSAFSRSRLYFWVLGCLNEFDPMIEDNIKQWKLYRRARIQGRLDPDSTPMHSAATMQQDLKRLLELDKKAGDIEQSLEDLRAEFSAKHNRVRALREGLFNASALMESRSSTRLGQNVQLLTYVSIFYLPLGFCAALWAIPNITDHKTKIPFIVTATLVGSVTYLVVANLGNITQFAGRSFQSWKDQLLKKMREDYDGDWCERSERFEEFPPQYEKKKASDWLLLRYQMHRFWGILNLVWWRAWQLLKRECRSFELSKYPPFVTRQGRRPGAVESE